MGARGRIQDRSLVGVGTQRITELAYEIPAGQREIRSRLEEALDAELGGRTYDNMIENAIKASGRGEVVTVLFEIAAEHARSKSEEEPELHYHCLVTEAGEVKKLGKVWRRWFRRWRSRHWRIDHTPADDEEEATAEDADEPATDGGVDEDDGDAEEAPSFPAFDEIVVSDANPEERHDLVLADFQKRAIAALDATFEDEE